MNSVITTFGTELKTYVDLFNRATGQVRRLPGPCYPATPLYGPPPPT